MKSLNLMRLWDFRLEMPRITTVADDDLKRKNAQEYAKNAQEIARKVAWSGKRQKK